uniref:Peptidase S1 domain-containing protein n=1 Tax=Glossina morsitans morsitans TaxID=37546 RepID=A0A1B0FHN0_GLOMM
MPTVLTEQLAVNKEVRQRQFFLSIATNLSDCVNDNSKDADDYVFMIAGGFRPADDFLTKLTVSIRTRQPTKFFGDNHFCNGAVISWNIVLSAAHCVVDQYGVVTRPHRLSVTAGCSGRLRKTITCMEYRVLKIIPHPQFHRHRGNDIALLILETTFPASNKKIGISSLATQPPAVGTVCQAVGWGQIYWDGPFADEAICANLTVTSNNECISNYDYNFADDLLCVMGMSFEIGLCRGDSGAPLFCDDKLHGILSEGLSLSLSLSLSFSLSL